MGFFMISLKQARSLWMKTFLFSGTKYLPLLSFNFGQNHFDVSNHQQLIEAQLLLFLY